MLQACDHEDWSGFWCVLFPDWRSKTGGLPESQNTLCCSRQEPDVLCLGKFQLLVCGSQGQE